MGRYQGRSGSFKEEKYIVLTGIQHRIPDRPAKAIPGPNWSVDLLVTGNLVALTS
jgi:hypothetical protein